MRSPRTTSTSQSRSASGRRSVAPWRSAITLTRTRRVWPMAREPGNRAIRFADVRDRRRPVRLRAHAGGFPQDGGGSARGVRSDPRPDRGGPGDRGPGGGPPHRPGGERGRPPGGGVLSGAQAGGARPRGPVRRDTAVDAGPYRSARRGPPHRDPGSLRLFAHDYGERRDPASARRAEGERPEAGPDLERLAPAG